MSIDRSVVASIEARGIDRCEASHVPLVPVVAHGVASVVTCGVACDPESEVCSSGDTYAMVCVFATVVTSR